MCMCVCVCVCVCVYVRVYVCIYMHMHTQIYQDPSAGSVSVLLRAQKTHIRYLKMFSCTVLKMFHSLFMAICEYICTAKITQAQTQFLQYRQKKFMFRTWEGDP